MRKRLTITTGTMLAAAAGIAAGLLAKKVTEQKKGDPVEEPAPDAQDDTGLFAEELTKDKLTGYLERLFRVFNPMDLRDLFEDYDIPQDRLVPHYVRKLTEEVYEPLRHAFSIFPEIRDTDEHGKDIADVKWTLFSSPAACIYRDCVDFCFDQSSMLHHYEIWLVAEGEGKFAAVRCIEREQDGAKWVYRFVERYIEFEEDLLCDSDDLYRYLLGTYGSGEKEDGPSC